MTTQQFKDIIEQYRQQPIINVLNTKEPVVVEWKKLPPNNDMLKWKEFSEEFYVRKSELLEEILFTEALGIKGPMGSKSFRENVTVHCFETGEWLQIDHLNAGDLVRTGKWKYLSDLTCDACAGHGSHNGEKCWHCEGEKVDPTKVSTPVPEDL